MEEGETMGSGYYEHRDQKTVKIHATIAHVSNRKALRPHHDVLVRLTYPSPP